MPEVIKGLTFFQLFLLCFGGGGFLTAGGIVYAFGRKAQKVDEISKDIEEGNSRFKTIEITLTK